jgi:uncharacterized membrane protein YagU involved in acid resistance
MIADGIKAGLAGAAAMSVSTNLEMRIRGRGPSAAPAQALERMFGVKPDSPRAEQAMVAAAHVSVSVAVGALGALLRPSLPAAAAGAALFAAALAPELIVVPGLGVVAPPWEWSAQEMAVAILHHAVYAAATTLVLERLVDRP